jgi:DNA-binding transcriptional LysR family regulator
VRPFQQTITGGAYFLAWHEDRDDDPLVASFRAWIATALAAEAPP